MNQVSLPWMESVDAKVRRAKEHLWTLNRDLAEAARSYQPTIYLKQDDQRVWLIVLNGAPYLPMEHSVVFGDFLHNLRSSLDALVYGLVKRAGGEPTRHCAFPVLLSQSDFEKRTSGHRDALAGVPSAARTIIRDLQPFQRGIGNMELDPLHQLNTMWNEDKHRSSHIVLGYSKRADFRLHTRKGPIDVSSNGPLLGYGPWRIDLPIAPKDLTGPETRVHAKGAMEFLTTTTHPWQGQPVLDFANNCVRYVEEKVMLKLRLLFE